MKAAQIRSLPVQALLVLGLFFGSAVLAIGIVSQRWRFESYLKETYAPAKGDDSEKIKKITAALAEDEPAGETWNYLIEAERRSVYCEWVRNVMPGKIPNVRGWRETDEEFFVSCAERTVVCGNQDQRMIGLALLERCSPEHSIPALQRLADWAMHARRLEMLESVKETQIRVDNSRTPGEPEI
jgi:hypothetical protein